MADKKILIEKELDKVSGGAYIGNIDDKEKLDKLTFGEKLIVETSLGKDLAIATYEGSYIKSRGEYYVKVKITEMIVSEIYPNTDLYGTKITTGAIVYLEAYCLDYYENR